MRLVAKKNTGIAFAMKNVQKAKFFCENCGAEVPENARMCKTCGKFFISVRCPRCGATGTHTDFSDGCPKCGYAVNRTSDSSLSEKKTSNRKKNSVKFKRHHFSQGLNERTSWHDESSLPLWVYIITGSVLVAVIFAIYSCI